MLETPAVDARRRAVIAGAFAAVGAPTLLPAVGVPAAGTALAPPERSAGLSLALALARRRSVRGYAPQPLTLDSVAQLLWAAQGITGPGGRRTAPSAGALYPLEIHLVATRVEGLAAGAHRYLPQTHALQSSNARADAAALRNAAMGQQAVGAAAAVVIITAVEQRTAARYGTRAGRYIAFEAGAAAQNLALQGVALGLGCVVIGAFDEAAVARELSLPGGEAPVVMMPIGALPDAGRP